MAKKRSQRGIGDFSRSCWSPLLAIVTALLVGAMLIIVTDLDVIAAFTRIPRRVAVPFTDPATEISLEEALWLHPDEVIVGDAVEVKGKDLRVVDELVRRQTPDRAGQRRELYPELTLASRSTEGFSSSPWSGSGSLALGERGLCGTIRRRDRQSQGNGRGIGAWLEGDRLAVEHCLLSSHREPGDGDALHLGGPGGGAWLSGAACSTSAQRGSISSAAWQRYLWATAQGTAHLDSPSADACWQGLWVEVFGARSPACSRPRRAPTK